MRRLLLVAGLVACRNSDESFPVSPGGAGPGGSHLGVDAAIDSGDGGANFVGRVCVISDPRLPTTGCATTGVAGFLVTLGLNTATTGDDGTFAIQATAATNAVWTVTGGTTIVPTVAPFTASPIIPAVLSVPFLDLENANGIVPSPGNGAVFVRMLHNGTPVAGATAIATGMPANTPFYDPPSGDVWLTTATGSFGVAWLPGVLQGTQAVIVTPPLSTATLTLSNVPVVEGALTFVTAELF
jgi:hypothetical protein